MVVIKKFRVDRKVASLIKSVFMGCGFVLSVLLLVNPVMGANGNPLLRDKDHGGQVPAIIPLPEHYTLAGNRAFTLEQHTPIVLGDEAVSGLIDGHLRRQWQALFKQNIYVMTGLRADFLFVNRSETDGDHDAAKIILKTDQQLGEGAYQLKIDSSAAVITARDRSGFLYGLVSFLQLAVHNGEPSSSVTHLTVPCWQISDRPKYGWRGLMLDESRHFFGKQQVEKLLTWMAYYKLNKLHWHLTDEPAWRVEIKAFPKLTTIGAMGTKWDSTAPARFYTQDDIREVVAYAASLGIEVIPEIDMPGHATAANRAYPENSGRGVGKFHDFTFNPGRDSTYLFLTTILREVHDVFGSDLIHLGGDEVSFGSDGWNQLPAVDALKAKYDLKDNKDVEGYFLRRMADSALQFNRKVLTWDEGVDAGLDPDNTVIFWWRHDKTGALKGAVEGGYDVVMCPRIPLYFDFVQDSAHLVGRKWSGRYASLKQVFDFEPSDYTKGMDVRGRVLGLQANLWTETVQTPQRLDFMLFPRMAALADAAWSRASDRQYDQFEDHLKADFLLYRKAGLYYYDPFDPDTTPEVKQ